jgi:hypothetical protein
MMAPTSRRCRWCQQPIRGDWEEFTHLDCLQLQDMSSSGATVTETLVVITLATQRSA